MDTNEKKMVDNKFGADSRPGYNNDEPAPSTANSSFVADDEVSQLLSQYMVDVMICTRRDCNPRGLKRMINLLQIVSA